MKQITLRLAHLYPKRMSIYGDRGNIMALSKRCEWRGIGLEVERVEVGEALDAGHYDLFFFGGGQDIEQLTVAADLAGKAAGLLEAHRAGAAFLAVCGGYQLLGRSYTPAFAQPGPSADPKASADSAALPGIGLFPVETAAGSERLIGNVVAYARIPELSGQAIVGFENHSGLTTLDEGVEPLATVQHGYGNNGHDQTEGCVVGSAVGTYLHGSLLPKNPHVADWLLERALQYRHPTAHLPELPTPADVFEQAANHQIAARFG